MNFMSNSFIPNLSKNNSLMTELKEDSNVNSATRSNKQSLFAKSPDYLEVQKHKT